MIELALKHIIRTDTFGTISCKKKSYVRIIFRKKNKNTSYLIYCVLILTTLENTHAPSRDPRSGTR